MKNLFNQQSTGTSKIIKLLIFIFAFNSYHFAEAGANATVSAQTSKRPNKITCSIQSGFLSNDNNNMHKTAYAVLKLNYQGLYDNAVMIDAETKKKIPELTLSNLILMDKKQNEVGLMLIIKNVYLDKENFEYFKTDRYAVDHIYKN